MSLFGEPLKMTEIPMSGGWSRIHRWLWRPGNNPQHLLRAVIASDELGVHYEPKPYTSQTVDWGWMQVASLLWDQSTPLLIGSPTPFQDPKGDPLEDGT